MKWGKAWLVRGAPPRHALLINQPSLGRLCLYFSPFLLLYLSYLFSLSHLHDRLLRGI